jgi:hypothetical protein
MPFLRPIMLSALVVITGTLAACGGGSDPAPVASDTSVPLDGRSVSGANQLTGTWMAISDGPLAGVEFLKDAQAMLTRAGSGTTTVSFKVLDAGRLSLVTAQGATTNYRTTRSGDTLELAPEQPGTPVQRFARVPSGQTLAEAAAAHEAKMVERMRQRIIALSELLRQGDIVLAADGADAWRIALRFDNPEQSVDGTLVLDQSPQRPSVLAPVLVLPMRGDTEAAGARTDAVRFVLNAGPATEPAGQQDVSGVVRLSIEGPPDKPVVSGTAHFPKLWPEPRAVTLRRDATVHAATIARLEAERGARKAEFERMKAFLAGRIVLTGTRKPAGNAGPDTVRITLERNAQDNAYDAVVTASNRADAPAQAGIDLVLGRAALLVITPWGEQWRLQTTEAPDTLEGQLRPNAREGFLGHGTVSLAVQRRWTAEQIAAERAATEVYFNQTLRTPQRFVGSIPVRYGTNTTYWPVSVELQANADGSATGSAWLVAHRRGATLGGRTAGRAFDLSANGVMEGSEQARPDRHSWKLALSGIDPEPVFAGQASVYTGGGVVTLRPATEQHYRDSETAFVDAIRGRTFAVVRTDSSTSRDENTFLRVTDVSADGSIAGEILGDGPGMWSPFTPPALFRGVIENTRGVPVARVTVSPAPEPNYGGGRDGAPFELSFAPSLDPDNPVVAGWTNPERGNQDWFVLTPVDPGAPIPMNPTQQTRLAALRLGATTNIPENPSPGDSVVVIVSVTERDRRVGQLFFADGRYTHRNSVPAAAIHAGLANPGEICILRLTYAAPFTAAVEASERNGMASQRANFGPANPLPTFTIERLPAD